eukprot:scaffold24096_cov64-Phaeocystis_antarctica.AAC.20
MRVLSSPRRVASSSKAREPSRSSALYASSGAPFVASPIAATHTKSPTGTSSDCSHSRKAFARSPVVSKCLDACMLPSRRTCTQSKPGFELSEWSTGSSSTSIFMLSFSSSVDN